MKNFDDPDQWGSTLLAPRGPQPIASATSPVISLHRQEERRSWVGKPDSEWTAEDLRFYVVSQIEQLFGSFDRKAPKERAVFRRFFADWGETGVKAARYVFEACDGMWLGQPVTVNRFCRGSDPYFIVPLAERLQAA